MAVTIKFDLEGKTKKKNPTKIEKSKSEEERSGTKKSTYIKNIL